MLGILGAGQLGRMLALEAYKLGITPMLYSNKPNDCGLKVVSNSYVGAYENCSYLTEFAKSCSHVTFEFENIPIAAVESCRKHTEVNPCSEALAITAERTKEKELLNSLGIPTAKYVEVATKQDIENFQAPSKIVKTNSGGYDGKGQWTSNFDKVDFSQKLIVEEKVELAKEISVIVARDKFGSSFCYDPAENVHENQILKTSAFPASTAPELSIKAKNATLKVAEELNYIGVLCLEFFITTSGDLLANEIAPRVHNSGHHTLETCSVSQFEQHVRAVSGLPIITEVVQKSGVMINIIGGCNTKNIKNYQASLHWYDKDDEKTGRKIGHITTLTENFRQIEEDLYGKSNSN